VRRLVVGLTGGIGSGKSTVAGILRKSGAVVIDADALGHRVLEIPRIRAALVRDFGAAILGEDGRIDRRALGRKAFRNKAATARLNRRVHPEILNRIRRGIRRARGCVVLDAALLYETGAEALCDRVWFVDAPRRRRLERIRARGWSAREVSRRERTQMPLREKKRRADVVIDNGGPVSRTEREVLERLTEQAREGTR
jgi:dephospho-CoA kinase